MVHIEKGCLKYPPLIKPGTNKNENYHRWMHSVFSYPSIGIRLFRALVIPYNYNFNNDGVIDITYEEFMFKKIDKQTGTMGYG